jgi:SAM-dependent methyltransferase
MTDMKEHSQPGDSTDRSYDTVYEAFDSPLAQQMRAETYGEDIGQHSWVTADDLRADVAMMNLSPTMQILDLGCGPCGPLTFIVSDTGCRGIGLDVSAAAIAAGAARAAARNVDARITLQQADLNEPISLPDHSCDAVVSFDAILHLRDREAVLREVRRVLVVGGLLLFTGAGVIDGPISNESIRHRTAHGYTQLAPRGFNEKILERTGFQISAVQDRTHTPSAVASNRLASRLTHRVVLEKEEGDAYFTMQVRYLESVVELAQQGALRRMMYVARVAQNRP